MKLDFLPRCQVHFPRHVNPHSGGESFEGNRPALSIGHGGRGLNEELTEVLELDLLPADVANPDDQPHRFAVALGSLLAGMVAQACLQATDFLTPCSEAFLLMFLWRFRPFLSSERLVVLCRRRAAGKDGGPGCSKPNTSTTATTGLSLLIIMAFNTSSRGAAAYSLTTTSYTSSG